MQMPPQALEPKPIQESLLSLAAHEMFHTWNVKRLRPAALRNIDLSGENYTDLLWFCEGTTSYYDELILVRAGLETPAAYLKNIAEVDLSEARPAGRARSEPRRVVVRRVDQVQQSHSRRRQRHGLLITKAAPW